MDKWIYAFGNGNAEGSADMNQLLGGKGANLAEMSRLGIPVPPGFTITTEACNYFTANSNNYPSGLEKELSAAMNIVESTLGAIFGGTGQPLLVSVRSGSQASMPGMMDTVLNLGLNDTTVEALANVSGNARFAYDSYRRFIQMFGDVVLGVEYHVFEDILEDHKMHLGITLDTDLVADDWKNVIVEYKRAIELELGVPFPQDPVEQLWGAIGAVFGSWMNPRAIVYRELHGIPEDWGTAVNIQAMVFGNMGSDCSTGVCFTRNPSTGEKHFYGEFLINAQGEDVVAGIRTPHPLSNLEKMEQGTDLPSMEETMPQIYEELLRIGSILEAHYKDMQDMEFTVQQNKLWMLQTRLGKRTAKASLAIALDLVNEGHIKKNDAIIRIDPNKMEQLLHPMLDTNAQREIIGKGLPASPGAATGKIVFSAKDAEQWAANDEKIILVRAETSPEDISGMHVSQGVLTTRGGMTSHAAVVARGMGKPCVSGAGDMHVDYSKKTLKAAGIIYVEGDLITLDGSNGEVFAGAVEMIQPELTGEFAELMEWVDEVRKLSVRANAETPTDALIARKFGAEGIGLSRTEHMFFEPERIIYMREMILAGNENARRTALQKLLPYQRSDFTALFDIMDGLPVTIRLLDPPLHEFIPHGTEEIQEVADAAGVSVAIVKERAAELREVNPMLGHRGCRLGLTYPEIYEMQARAIFEAAAEIEKRGGQVEPEIMIPLIISQSEFDFFKNLVDRIAEEVVKETKMKLRYLTGAMVELPRAVLCADDIAKSAEFFSFGTNDLTQTCFGLSRDDAGSFLSDYYNKGVLSDDPFVTIDKEGVGELIRIGVGRGRSIRPDIKVGICGEHGGDPKSIYFCHEIGLDYISCSPYRVPIAKLAAAQAVLLEK